MSEAATSKGTMKVFGLAGWSGSGKTTLMIRLIPELVGRGLRVSTMKHAHHGFDMDEEGKDSFEHRRAGAQEVLITSARRWALMHELRDAEEPDVAQLIDRMTPVDLLLIEGFKRQSHEKLEVYRAAVGKPLLCLEDPQIVAVASDGPLDVSPREVKADLPRLDLNDIPAIADFIVRRCGLTAVARGAA